MVLTGTYNLCFKQECEKYQDFLSENFPFLVVKFSIYLNRRMLVIFGSKDYITGSKTADSVLLNMFVNTTVLSTSLGKTFFAWRFILNENILF